MKTPNLNQEWLEKLTEQFTSSYMAELRIFLQKELKHHKLFPAMKDVFNAFLYTPFSKVKVVIIGQDPYHNPGQAHGLCFSVREGTKPPPSLVNIYKEIRTDLANRPREISDITASPYPSGELTRWSEQGVFLLNSILTVRQNAPGSHRNQGWERFTDTAIQLLSEEREHLVFLLWGSFAQEKVKLVDESKHLILTSPHPSPFSADRGFFGCRHFSKVNDYLQSYQQSPIIW